MSNGNWLFWLLFAVAVFSIAALIVQGRHRLTDESSRMKARERLTASDPAEPLTGTSSGAIAGSLKSEWSEKKQDHKRATIYRSDYYHPNK